MTGPPVDGAANRLAGSRSGPATAVLTATGRPVATLPPELVDLITEAVATPATAAARAEVVAAMLLRALDAVTWRQGLQGDGTEESSLLRVVKAAEGHRSRMGLAADRAR